MDSFFRAKEVAALLVDSEALGIAFDSWVLARGAVLSGDPTDPIPVNRMAQTSHDLIEF